MFYQKVINIHNCLYNLHFQFAFSAYYVLQFAFAFFADIPKISQQTDKRRISSFELPQSGKNKSMVFKPKSMVFATDSNGFFCMTNPRRRIVNQKPLCNFHVTFLAFFLFSVTHTNIEEKISMWENSCTLSIRSRKKRFLCSSLSAVYPSTAEAKQKQHAPRKPSKRSFRLSPVFPPLRES